MLALEILKAGPMTTIQDGGRTGWRRFGVPRSGAMDIFSMVNANTFVGNPAMSPVLEIYAGGFECVAHMDLTIAIMGAKGDIRLNGRSVGGAIEMKAHDRLELRPFVSGQIAYLAIQGRLHAQEVFGSCSTHLIAALGGFNGRRLSAGDQLVVTKSNASQAYAQLTVDKGPIRILKGPEWERLNMQADVFEKMTFTIGRDSSRSGIRLTGESLHYDGKEMESVPVLEGTMQLSTGGTPIVLMADGPTTGGYPRIAQVLKADLGRLAQLVPGSEVRFTFVSDQEAHQIFQGLSPLVRHAFL